MPTFADHAFAISVTYVPTWMGFLYLAVVLDCFSRRVVGWATAARMPVELVLQALDMAVRTRRPAAGVIHHSDGGSQYTALAFGLRCQAAGIVPSMGSVGDAYDNALCESFFASLETELIDRSSYRTHDQTRTALFDYIEALSQPGSGVTPRSGGTCPRRSSSAGTTHPRGTQNRQRSRSTPSLKTSLRGSL